MELKFGQTCPIRLKQYVFPLENFTIFVPLLTEIMVIPLLETTGGGLVQAVRDAKATTKIKNFFTYLPLVARVTVAFMLSFWVCPIDEDADADASVAYAVDPNFMRSELFKFEKQIS